MPKKTSLAKDFKLFSFIALTITFVFSFCIVIIIYFSQKSDELRIHKEQASYIDQFLNEHFNYVTYYAKFLGHKIIEHHESEDYSFIAKIFQNGLLDDVENQNLYSWTLFDWINPDKKIIINTKHGILNPPIDISARTYLNRTYLEPWKLIFDDPSIGIPSAQLIIPVGVGVKDKNGKFYGTIGTGFNIDKLTSKIEQLLKANGIKFVILNENFKFITSSSNIVAPEEVSTLVHQLEKLINLTKINSTQFNNINFTYHKKASNYPFYIVIGEDKNVSYSKFLQNIFPRIAESLFMGAVCIILLYYSRKKLVTPIIKLADIAARIAREDKYIDIPSSPEYLEINILRRQLKEIQFVKKQLLVAQESLEQKVEERTTELEKALSAKLEFLNNMSHEVRTPIQGVTAISEGLVEHWQDFTNEKRFELANNVARNAKRLFSLVSNLLDLSKLTSGTVTLHIEQININSIIEDMIEECKELYVGNKNIKIKFIDNAKNSRAYIDEEKIIQVLRNLFANAIKFMNKGDIIATLENSSINLNDEKIDALLFSLKDQGIGIPENELENIFEPFTQSSKTKTKAGGTGLGLAICRKIISLHHGKIWAENNQDQAGSSFHFLIPTKQPKILIASHREANILLIDDEDSCIISMNLLLHGTKYKLFSAKTGEEALKCLNESKEKIDLILLDLMLPDIYGISLLSKIKKDPKFNSIPVILQSGISDKAEIAKAFKIGVKSFISKPYNKEKLLSEISKVLEANNMDNKF